MVWYGIVWYGGVSGGVVCDMVVQCGMVWYNDTTHYQPFYDWCGVSSPLNIKFDLHSTGGGGGF